MTPNPMLQFVPILLIFGVMYFMLIRPQQKQQQALAAMQTNLKKNDEVVTIGGMFGVVVNLKDAVVTLRVDDNVRIDVERNSIARLVKTG
jgi:preprotein translocase subunit YajC